MTVTLSMSPSKHVQPCMVSTVSFSRLTASAPRPLFFYVQSVSPLLSASSAPLDARQKPFAISCLICLYQMSVVYYRCGGVSWVAL